MLDSYEQKTNKTFPFQLSADTVRGQQTGISKVTGIPTVFPNSPETGDASNSKEDESIHGNVEQTCTSVQTCPCE